MKTFRQFFSTPYHDVLNPTIWDGEEMYPTIRTKLLKFAESWAEFAKIPKNIIDDVLMVGGSAGYNYTDQSDIDVHLLLDRDKLGNRALVDEYLQTKKSLWGLEHHVTVAGLPVEGYAQSREEKTPKSQGVFSLQNNKWVTKPEHPPETIDTTSKSFQSKVYRYRHNIEHLIATDAPLAKFKIFRDKLKNMRSFGLSRGGEYDEDNVKFKILRNMGVLDRMSKYVHDRENKEMSS